MNETSVSATIDWLAFTIHWNQSALQTLRKGYALDALASTVTGHAAGWIKEKPRNGYPYVVSAADRPGLCVMASEPDAPMGVHVSWAGSALREVNPRAVLRLALNMGAIIRRIDLAVDIPHEMNPITLYEQLETHLAKTASKKHQQIISDTGWTVYVGSRTSEKFLRIYDKQAEAGLDKPLTRIELECKNDYAHGIGQHIDKDGYQEFPAIIKAFCDFPNYAPWVEHLTSPTLFEGIPKAEKQSDTRRWLMESVAPSLAKILKEDHDFYLSFLLKVMSIAGVGEVQQPPDPFEGAADFDPSGPYAMIR